MRNRLLLLLLVLILAACGFHLRGVGTMALPPIGVQGSGVFADFLRDYLSGLQSKQASTPPPTLQVHIFSELYNKEILSITSNGRIAEYRLVYHVDYEVVDKGHSLIERSVLKRERVLSWRDDAILAKENEEATLVRDMRQDVAQNILWRIDAVLKNTQKETQSSPASVVKEGE